MPRQKTSTDLKIQAQTSEKRKGDFLVKMFNQRSVEHFKVIEPQALEGVDAICGTPRDYKLMLGYAGQKTTPEHCQVAVLFLYPGVTILEAQRAATLLVKKLPKSNKSKPSLSPRLVQRMRQWFDCAAKTGERNTRPVICRAVAEKYKLSLSAVQKEYRKWLDAQGLPKKRYWRD